MSFVFFFNDTATTEIYTLSLHDALPISGGGAAILPDGAAAEHILYLATQAKAAADYYDHHELGYNYRMSNLLAAVGIAQLQSFDFRIERKRAIHHQYLELLGDLPLAFQEGNTGKSCFWLTCATLTTDRITPGRLCQLLDEQYNIEARRIWKPMHLQPFYQGCESVLNGQSDYLFEKGICLPSGVGMTDDQIQFVANAVKKVLM